MNASTARPSLARATYQQIAPLYDQLTADHDYELWLSNLLPAAEGLGLGGRRALDIACGTGKSFLPLVRRGWKVTACDISPAMLAQARAKAGKRVRFELADMRQLPCLGCFDLVLCLGDSINYLLTEGELRDCFAGVRANLGAGGLLIFDTNTLKTFQTSYSQQRTHHLPGGRVIWQGQESTALRPGSVVEASMELVAGAAHAGPSLVIHQQKHFSPAEVVAALSGAGLECLAVFGHGYDAKLEQPLDEGRHSKAIFMAKASKEGR